MKIITNNVPRLLLDANQLTDRERAEFDYVDWENPPDFMRYRGRIYDLSEFMLPTSTELAGWDGMSADTFFSAIVVKFVPDDADRVIVGLALA